MKMRKTAIALTLLLILSTLLSACVRMQTNKPEDNEITARETERGNAFNSENPVGPQSEQKEHTEILVSETESSTVAVQSGEGVFTVSLPEGSLSGGTQLTISGYDQELNEVVSPGFMLEEAGRPGEHVELKIPATITYLQKEPLGEGWCIVKYSEDGKSFEPVESVKIKINDAYGLYAVVDSFSGYGVAKVTPEQIQKMADSQLEKGFIWVLEAKDKCRLTNMGDAETIDLTFYIRATSRRLSEDPEKRTNFKIGNGLHYGIFDANSFVVSKEKADVEGKELPLVFGFQMSDPDLKLRIIPKFKPIEEEIELVPLVPSSVPEIELAPLIAPELEGYVGWGNIMLRFSDYVGPGGQVQSSSEDDFDPIPCTVQIKAGVAKVYFSFPGYGKVQLKGTYLGKGVEEARQAPPLEDPKKTYSPSAPEKPLSQWDSNLSADDMLSGLTQNNDGNVVQKIQTNNGVLMIEFDFEGDEEEQSIPSPAKVLDLFSLYDQVSSQDDE